MGDVGRQQVVDRKSLVDPLADFGGGNTQGPAAQRAKGERFHGARPRRAGSRDHDEVDETGEQGGIAPMGEGGHVIGADEPEKPGVGKARSTGADGVDGITGAAATELQFVDLKVGMAGKGDAQPAQSKVIRGGCVGGFEGRPCGGNEDDAIELEFFTRRFSHEEMAEVDRVEGTAIETNAHGEDQQQRWMPSKRLSAVST